MNQSVTDGQLASIIIITHNRLEYTKLCIQSLLKKTNYHPHEIIAVDNHSTDGTSQYLINLRKNELIQGLILLDANYGAGYATNQGLKRARGQYLIRTDNDMVYNLGWLTALVEALQRIPKSLLQVAVFGELVQDGRQAGFSPEKSVNGVIVNPVNIGGCNMAFTRETYEDLGPFDRVMYAEDGLYCDRALKKGYFIGQIDNATATHIDHPTCSLSRRYTDYARYRIKVLQKLRNAGVEFLCPEDYSFYEEYMRKRSPWEGNVHG